MRAAATTTILRVRKPAPVGLNIANRTRGMWMRSIAKPDDKLLFVEGLQRADKRKEIIVSHTKIDFALTSIVDPSWRLVPDVFPCHAGTMTGYEEPGKPLGEEITYTDPKGHLWIFPVPQEFRGEVNAILVTEHPFYLLEIKDNTRIVRAAIITLIKEFPAEKGWYLADLAYRIPVLKLSSSYEMAKTIYEIYGTPEVGAEKCPHPYARYLHRLEKRVGPAMRSTKDSHHVFLNEAFDSVGMLAEAA